MTKTSALLYRKPAYLICTDNRMSIRQILQSYLWRWGIVVNFRDQKTLFGCGQAQVRMKTAVEKVPTFITAVYAMLQLAMEKTEKNPENNRLPRPKWYRKNESKKATTGDAINQFKAQWWAESSGINFTNFVQQAYITRSRKNNDNPMLAAAFYSRR